MRRGGSGLKRLVAVLWLLYRSEHQQAYHLGVQAPECARWTTRPIGELFKLTWSARGLQRALDRRFPDRDRWPSRVWVTAEGLVWDGDDGGLYGLSFAQVSEVLAHGSGRIVLSDNGCVVFVIGSSYRGGRELIYAIDTRVAPQLRVGRDGGPSPAVVRPRCSLRRLRWRLRKIMTGR